MPLICDAWLPKAVPNDSVQPMSAAPPAGHRTGANRWERGTLWLQHVDPASGGGGTPAAARVRPGSVYDVREGPGRGRAVSIYIVLDIDAPPKRALAFVVCYPTGGSVAEAILPLFSTDPPPNAAFFARQTVGGTCGTVALLNALLNAPGVALPELGLAGDRPSAAAVLAAPAVRAAHDRAAGAAGSAEAGRRQGRHFVALVKVAKTTSGSTGSGPGPSAPAREAKKGRSGSCGSWRTRCWTRGPTRCFPSWRWSTPRRGRAAAATANRGRRLAAAPRHSAAGAAGDAPRFGGLGPATPQTPRRGTHHRGAACAGDNIHIRSCWKTRTWPWTWPTKVSSEARLVSRQRQLLFSGGARTRSTATLWRKRPVAYFDVAAAQRLLHGERKPRLGRRRRRRDRRRASSRRLR